MRMNFTEVLAIEALGNHSAATAIDPGILPADTVNVTPGSKRKNSYEVEDGSTVYYILVSPFSGTIFFLAAWEKLMHFWCISAGGSKVPVLLSANHHDKNNHAFNAENRAFVRHRRTAPSRWIVEADGDRANPRQPWYLCPNAGAGIFRRGSRS